MTNEDFSRLDACSVIFQPGIDWHTLWNYPPEAQVAFILEQAKTEQEEKLAKRFMRLKGLYIPYAAVVLGREAVQGVQGDVEDDGVDPRTEDQQRYDEEEQQLRNNFFRLSPRELDALFALMVDPMLQQEAARLFLTRLSTLDGAITQAIDSCQQNVLQGADPVSSFLKAYVVFETLVRSLANEPALKLTDEDHLIRCFPALEPWIRHDYVIELGIMADDPEALRADITQHIQLLLFVMARAAVALLCPGDAALASSYSTSLYLAKDWSAAYD